MPTYRSPSRIRKAATILLVREKDNHLETYLLKRSSKSRFMPGLYVFPGGVVDPEDMDFSHWNPYIDLDKKQLQTQLGKKEYPVEQMLGFCIAAIRETLEEAGVFLASGKDKKIADINVMARYRLKDQLKRSWFKEKIQEQEWILSLSQLKRWSHWITPEHMKQRFDTLFFMVPMPADQTCVPDEKETEKGVWISPQNALEKNMNGTIPMSPPTLISLTQMSNASNLKELSQQFCDHPWPDAITPRGIKSPKGPVVLMPWDPLYETAPSLGELNGPIKVLRQDEPFSRVLNDNGFWKPIGE